MRMLIVLAVLVAGCGLGPIGGAGWHNRESGDGWRLLASGTVRRADAAYLVHAAADLDAYQHLWREVAGGERPEADLSNEVVVSFAHGIGSSCPELRLDDVVIDGTDVYSVASDPLADRFCTADLVGAVVFVVAIERSALPDDGFTLWLSDAARSGHLNSEPLEVRLP